MKCTTFTSEQFSGKHFTQCRDKSPINIIFKETHKLDTISTDKIVSDINVESLGLYRFAVNKKELDDILITISELHNN